MMQAKLPSSRWKRHRENEHDNLPRRRQLARAAAMRASKICSTSCMGSFMKTKSLRLRLLVPVAWLPLLASPAGAECWMTCPPGSTTAPSSPAAPTSTESQGATVKGETSAAPEDLMPAIPETAVQAAPNSRGEAKVSFSPRCLCDTGSYAGQDIEKRDAGSSKTGSSYGRRAIFGAAELVHTTSTGAAQEAVAPPAPILQPSDTETGVPAPIPIPAPVPGTSTIHVVPE